MREMGKDVLASSKDSMIRTMDTDVQLDEMKYDQLKHFAEMLIINGANNVEQIHKAINPLDIPQICKKSICGKILEGVDDIRHKPDNVSYKAGETGNGGVGYVHSLHV